MNMKSLLSILIFFLTYTGIASEGLSPPKNSKQVVIETAKYRELSDQFQYPSVVRTRIWANIQAETSGIIESVDVIIGQKVVVNQILGSIKNSDPVFSYNSLKIRSPINGIIQNIPFTKGTTIQKGENVFVVINPDKAYLEIQVVQNDLQKIKVGQGASFFAGDKKNQVDVEVIGVSPAVSLLTGTGTIELQFKNMNSSVSKMRSTESIKPLIGQLGIVQFQTKVRKGFLIPEKSLYYEGEKSMVKLLVDNKVKTIEVSIGEIQNGKIEITNGLKDNDLVITQASGYLAEDGEVSIISKDGKAL